MQKSQYSFDVFAPRTLFFFLVASTLDIPILNLYLEYSLNRWMEAKLLHFIQRVLIYTTHNMENGERSTTSIQYSSSRVQNEWFEWYSFHKKLLLRTKNLWFLMNSWIWMKSNFSIFHRNFMLMSSIMPENGTIMHRFPTCERESLRPATKKGEK